MAPPGGRRRLLPHRHRRARPEGGPGRRGTRGGAADWTDQLAARFAEAWAGLDIANDDFIRTTEPRHHQAVQHFLGRIYDNGFIYEDVYRGLYCVACEQYYTEDELVDGELCPIHRTPVEQLEEENYFFRLSAFEERLLDWYEANPSAVVPESKRNEALSFIKGGLRDISITRTSIDWGVGCPGTSATSSTSGTTR